MAQVNPLTREVLLKLVYYGPGLGGKTTSLQYVHASSPPETRGNIVSLATPVDRTLYFDFLPLRVPAVRGHPVRVQLFTVPGQVYFNATRKLLLTGADGIVFVADSQRTRQDANVESLENLAQNLAEQGRELAKLPHVLQFNKRDLPRVAEIEEMERTLNPHHMPAFPTCATNGQGVLDALDALVRRVLDLLEEQKTFGEPAGRPSTTPSFGRTDGALEDQIGRASDRLVRDDIERAARAAEAAKAALDEESATTLKLSERADRGPESAVIARGVHEPPLPLPTPDAAVRGRPQSSPPVDRLPRPSFGAPTPEPASRLGSGPTQLADTGAPAEVVVATLFAHEADAAARIERALRSGRFADAVTTADEVALRVLANAAASAGLGEGARDPSVVALCLGVDGARWLSFRRSVRRARAGAEVSRRDAMTAYVLVCDLALRRDAALI